MPKVRWAQGGDKASRDEVLGLKCLPGLLGSPSASAVGLLLLAKFTSTHDGDGAPAGTPGGTEL